MTAMISAQEAASRAARQNLDAAVERLARAIDRDASIEEITRLIGEIKCLERQIDTLDWGKAT